VHVLGFESEICGNFTWVKNFKFTHTIAFQSVLHADAKPWEDTGHFKVNYLVNAENF